MVTTGIPDRVPFFSVTMATYNRPKMLARALASLTEQDFSDFEVVVVDDGSEPPVDLSYWEGKLNIRGYRNRVNSGFASTLNRGINESRGRWIVFLDDDEEFLPGFLNKYHQFLQDKPENTVFSWCGIQFIPDSESEPGIRTNDPRLLRMPKENYLSEADVVDDAVRIGSGFGLAVPQATMHAVGLLDSELRVSEDTDLILKLIAYGAKPVPYYGLGVRCYFHRENSLTNDKIKNLSLHNIHVRLISRHYSTLQKYPRVWRRFCIESLRLLLFCGAYKSALSLLSTVIGARDFTFRMWGLLLVTVFSLPLFWGYKLWYRVVKRRSIL